uniref:Uncharacterized protein n=1 Tax=Skeletonema marinoi TaxID=267567 RepID=A0A6U3THY2_9STRA
MRSPSVLLTFIGCVFALFPEAALGRLVPYYIYRAPPTSSPTSTPSYQPSARPSSHPTSYPSLSPSDRPSSQPTSTPSSSPSYRPSLSSQPSSQPTLSVRPSSTSKPSSSPTMSPQPSSAQPSNTLLRTSNSLANSTISPSGFWLMISLIGALAFLLLLNCFGGCFCKRKFNYNRDDESYDSE